MLTTKANSDSSGSEKVSVLGALTSSKSMLAYQRMRRNEWIKMYFFSKRIRSKKEQISGL